MRFLATGVAVSHDGTGFVSEGRRKRGKRLVIRMFPHLEIKKRFERNEIEIVLTKCLTYVNTQCLQN